MSTPNQTDDVAWRRTRVATDQDSRDGRVYQDVQNRATPSDPRSPARHDRDRIYYSNAFRRLANVTQVLTPNPEGMLTHNRLTHSLKVAQIGRSIAELLISRTDLHQRILELGGIDADVVEAAALAHDLGHPPFGHIGEDVLDEYSIGKLDLKDGFEGNAQTFRIVCRLEPRSKRFIGLNLTAATRTAILKYPWQRAEKDANDTSRLANDGLYRLRRKKFGTYADDVDVFDDARGNVPHLIEGAQSLEAAIMDTADDITYALHDLEDFHSVGMLDVNAASEALHRWQEIYASATADHAPSNNPFEHLSAKLQRNYPKQFDSDRYEEAAGIVASSHLRGLLPRQVGYRRSIAGTRRLISRLISEYVGGIILNTGPPSTEEPPAVLDPDHWHQVQIWKEITQQYVIQRSDVAVVQRGQQQLLRQLLDLLRQWCQEEPKRLPRQLSEERDAWGDRAIIDYVAGLSDHQAIALHRGLTGVGPGVLAGRIE